MYTGYQPHPALANYIDAYWTVTTGKAFSGIVRFRAVWKRMRLAQTQTDMALPAVQGRYYDQAHFSNDIKRIPACRLAGTDFVAFFQKSAACRIVFFDCKQNNYAGIKNCYLSRTRYGKSKGMVQCRV